MSWDDAVGVGVRPDALQTQHPDRAAIDLNPPLVVTDETESLNVTISINIDTWFRSASGDLVNPESANKGGANEDLVEDNIEDSIEAFEDGKDDDDEDD